MSKIASIDDGGIVHYISFLPPPHKFCRPILENVVDRLSLVICTVTLLNKQDAFLQVSSFCPLLHRSFRSCADWWCLRADHLAAQPHQDPVHDTGHRHHQQHHHRASNQLHASSCHHSITIPDLEEAVSAMDAQFANRSISRTYTSHWRVTDNQTDAICAFQAILQMELHHDVYNKGKAVGAAGNNYLVSTTYQWIESTR